MAANLLADAGWAVTVLEAQDEPGGAVRSAEVTAPGFTNDLFSSFYPLGAASPVMQALDLEAYGLRWAHAPTVLAHPTPDGRCAVISRDLATTQASLETYAAGDGAAWGALVEEWQGLAPALLDAAFGPFPPVRSAGRLLARTGPAGALRLARRAVLPVRRLGEEHFGGEGARLLLAGNALHTDLSPEAAGSGIYGWLLAMMGQTVGWPVPVGGAGRLTDALVRRLAARGGDLRVGTPVTSVVVAGGRAMGVRTAAGESVRARRAVLADVAAPVLYRHLVAEHHLPAGLLRHVDRFQWDNSTIKVDWALSAPIPWRDPGPAGAGTVHLADDLDALTRMAGELAMRQVPSRPFLLLGQMTTADPTRSPAGTESAWAYTHVPAEVRGDAGGEGLTGAWTETEVRTFVARMEAVVEAYAPGFRDVVLARQVQAPRDLEQADATLVHGALNGGTAAPHQQLVFRPVPGLGRPETPVPGLYLASMSAHPGGGVHGACGANAARAALLAARPWGPLVTRGLAVADRRLRGDGA